MPLRRTKEQANKGASQPFRLLLGTGSPGHNLCLALGAAEVDGKQSDGHVNLLGDTDFSAEHKGLRPPTPGPVTSREQGLLDIGDQTSQEYLQEALKERENARVSVTVIRAALEGASKNSSAVAFPAGL